MKKIISLFFTILLFMDARAQFVSADLSKIAILPKQTVSVILTSDDSLNSVIKETIKYCWKACKYNFVDLNEIAEEGKLGDYYLIVISAAGSNQSGYSTNASYTEFGVSNNDISKACEKFKKNKEEGSFIINLKKNCFVRTFLDPSQIHNNFSHMGVGGIAFNRRETIGSTLKPNEFNNAIRLNLKTVNWLLTNDLEKYFKKEKGSGNNIETSADQYNVNSCELKNMILLVNASDTIAGHRMDATIKQFDLNEFKSYYHSEVKIETTERIADYIKNDSQNKYALITEGIYGRSPIVLIFRLTDGAILYGFAVPNASSPGYTKRIYKKFEDICK